MRPYNTDTGNPISSDESSAGGRSPPIMSLVGSSAGTGSTWMIETSPLSTATDEEIVQTEVICSTRVDENHRRINDFHYSHDITQTNVREINHQASLHHFESDADDPISRRPRHRGSRNRRKEEYSNTLTWRMDPSISLSDFTLTIIAGNDKDAIAKICQEKEKQRNTTSRREKWMVEGLYLDMSQSNESVNDRCDSAINNLNRHDDQDMYNTRMNSTPSSVGMVVEKYHLHKVNLAIGKRGCGYFARLFRRKNDDVNSIAMHRMEVPISCLPAIPAMLDYLYNPNPDAEVHATTATAIPLRFLGSFLRNPTLFDSATRFLQNDLRPETAVEYLKHAELYTQTKLIGICIRILAENFDLLKVTWYASLSPHLMKRVLYSKYFTCSTSSMAVCTKIASYCRCQSIDRAMLLSLTDVKIMPAVCPEEALFFIHLLSRSGMDLTDTSRDDHISLKERSLYQRCINAAPSVVQNIIDSSCQDRSGEWPIRTSKWKNTSTEYTQLPPQIKVELLEYTLAKRNHTT